MLKRNGRSPVKFSPGLPAPIIKRALRPPQKEALPYALLAAGIVLLALFLRLYRLGSLPTGISGDELFNAIDALRVGKEHWPIFFEGNNGREALFLYLMAGSLRLFGQTIVAIRLPAALLGTGSVWLAYLLGRDHFNQRVGLAAAGLTAVSLWPLMESRWGLRAVSLTFFTGLTLYLLTRAFRQRRWRDWILGGAALGLTLYTYIPARIFPLVPVIWFGWLLWSRRDAAQRQWPHFLASLLTSLLVFAPFGWYMWQFPDKVNQRIGTLTVALDQAIAQGSLAPLGPSVLGVLRMFSFVGDAEWRYHVSGKPLFDPVTSIFFYAGLLLCFWLAFSARAGAEKRPSYALLLLWTGAMLGPNAILEANSSFLRAAGAILPIYLITAVGFDTLLTFVEYRWRRLGKRPFWLALLAVGLALILADTWRSYAGVWNNQEDVRRIYQADMAMIGRYLNQNPPPDDVRVFLADSYVADLAPRTFAYYSDYAVAWFDAGTSFALGAPGEARELWIFRAVNETFPNALEERLPLETAVTGYTFENGDPAFSLYRLDSGALDWQPQQPLDVTFVDGPQLTGYDLPPDVFRGDAVPLFLHWQIPPGRSGLPNTLTYVRARLFDAQGNLWATSSSLLGYPQASWRAGDRFVQYLPLDVPAGMPPGEATLRFDLHDGDGVQAAVEGEDILTTARNRSQPFLVRSRPLPDFSPAAGMLVLDETLALQNATLSTLVSPGMAVDVALDWVALQQPAVDYRVQLQLALPGESQPFYTQTFPLWPGVYPPTAWQAGERVSSFHRLLTPLEMPTTQNPELRLRLLPPVGDAPLPITQGSATLAQMTLELRDRVFEPPPIPQPLQAQFGEAIRLLGYDLDAADARPGGSVTLTLFWQAVATPAENYTVFNHIIGPDGRLRGQFDSPPVGEAWLTATWLPGEVVVEQRVIPVEEGVENGRFPLAIGLYRAADGVRLPVTVNGEAQPNDQLVLTEVEVGGP